MSSRFEPQVVHIPDARQGEGQSAGVVLKESSHTDELRQAWVIRTWRDGRGVKLNLRDFVEGLARVGTFDLTGARVAMVTRHDGTTARDPIDLILIGRATATDTLDFLERRVLELDLSKNGEAFREGNRMLADIYTQYRDAIVTRRNKRLAKQNRLRDEWKAKMTGASNGDDDFKAKLMEWGEGKGKYYQGYLDEQNPVDEHALAELKKLLRRLSAWQPLQD